VEKEIVGLSSKKHFYYNKIDKNMNLEKGF
jgi:hypothetical protein